MRTEILAILQTKRLSKNFLMIEDEIDHKIAKIRN